MRRPKPISQAPRKYLVAGGLMFIAYEASISLSIGLATTNAQSVKSACQLFVADAAGTDDRRRVAQTRLGLRSAAVHRSHRRRGNGVGGENLDAGSGRQYRQHPLPYVLAFAGAFIWAIYATVTPSMSDGYDGTTIFFCCCCCAVDYPFRFGRRFAAVAPGIGGYIALLVCRVDCRRLRVLGYGMP
ncbi:MAG: hypothetical protein ACLT1O_05730 [Bifidobacterium pseudocatenulatum]